MPYCIHGRIWGFLVADSFFRIETGLILRWRISGWVCVKYIKIHTGLELSPEESINWATAKRNTTKRGKVPGGLGLKLLCEFIDLNGGCIQIVSDAGYWHRRNSEIVTKPLSYPFPGTVVNVEINTGG